MMEEVLEKKKNLITIRTSRKAFFRRRPYRRSDNSQREAETCLQRLFSAQAPSSRDNSYRGIPNRCGKWGFFIEGLSDSLRSLGFPVSEENRYAAKDQWRSIVFSQCVIQHHDENPIPFTSVKLFKKKKNNVNKRQIPAGSHIPRKNTKSSEEIFTVHLFGGVIKGIGQRYCPSME
jgi:hypothetical protein